MFQGLRKIFILIVIIFVGIGLYMVFNANWNTGYSCNINFGLDYANLPNYLVFIVTGISASLLFITLTDQRRSNQIAAFENRFFKFIDYHRENVKLIKYRKADGENKKLSDSWEGSAVFTKMHYEIKELLKEFMMNSNWDYTDIKNKKKAIDFVYQCYFYGAGVEGLRILRTIFKNEHDKYFKWNNFITKKIIENSKEEVYYSGHVRRLGHYFRNIYQAVKYVDQQTFLTENEKYEYVTTLRAQMTVYEQLVFFYNSLSELGSSWENEHYVKDYTLPFLDRMFDILKRNKKTHKARIYRHLFITKFDLIRNTLFNDSLGDMITIIQNGKNIEIPISIKEFYPLLCLEREEECSVHGMLPFISKTEWGKPICRFCFNRKYIGYKNEDYKRKLREYYANNKENIPKEKLDFCSEEDCKSWAIVKNIKK